MFICVKTTICSISSIKKTKKYNYYAFKVQPSIPYRSIKNQNFVDTLQIKLNNLCINAMRTLEHTI